LRLDPIVIVPHDPAWATSFASARDDLEVVLGPVLVRPIEHIGSTSIPGLGAKPIIDMVAVVAGIDDIDRLDPTAAGWVAALEPGDVERRRRSWCAPSVAHRTHHLHLVEESSSGWRGWLAFRDALRGDRALVTEYESLKRRLADEHGADPDDRTAYRAGKSAFVERVTTAALGHPG
jgi:GrpB-like predicted nucleotidyltransferase (UPF0157 family)